MSALEADRATIARIGNTLDIKLLRARWAAYERGSLPARSLGDGRGHTTATAPRPDRLDQRLQRDRAALIADLQQARRIMLRVEATYLRWIVAAPAIDPDQPDTWCSSCARAGICTPPGEPRHVGQTGLCRWCHGFHTEHDQLPPIELLRYRAEGRRITTRLITDTLRRGSRRR